MAANTGQMEILRAALESVSLRFRNIYDIMKESIGAPKEVIASGGALLHSPAWTQMMADALGRPVRACTELEASCRGAALWALERTGAIENLSALPASTGAVFSPRPDYEPVYDRLLSAQTRVFNKLFAT